MRRLVARRVARSQVSGSMAARGNVGHQGYVLKVESLNFREKRGEIKDSS